MSESEDPQKVAGSAEESSASDAGPPPKSRSRSASRRARRQKLQGQPSEGKQGNMPSVPETEEESPAPGAMQPFEHIGPDSTSMDGPVTYARAQRGEIPLREGDPSQALATGQPKGADPGDTLQRQQEQILQQQQDGDGGGKSDLMDQDGLKLRIDLNLDLEIEVSCYMCSAMLMVQLKAKLRGDITLALLA